MFKPLLIHTNFTTLQSVCVWWREVYLMLYLLHSTSILSHCELFFIAKIFKTFVLPNKHTRLLKYWKSKFGDSDLATNKVVTIPEFKNLIQYYFKNDTRYLFQYQKKKKVLGTLFFKVLVLLTLSNVDIILFKSHGIKKKYWYFW